MALQDLPSSSLFLGVAGGGVGRALFFLPLPKAQSALGCSLRDRREPSQGLLGRQAKKEVAAPCPGSGTFLQGLQHSMAAQTTSLIKLKCENAHTAREGE